MTHYYLYIATGDTITPDALCWKVAIGSSAQADRDLLFLTAYSVEHGHYFELWSSPVAEFWNKVVTSLQPNPIDLMPIAARKLVRYFKEGEPYEIPTYARQNAARTLYYLDDDYRVSRALSMKK